MITWSQYLSYLVAGLLYYFMLAAFFTVAAGYSMWAIALVLLALTLGGYASGMSLVVPRLAAVLGGGAALIFLVYCIALAFSETGDVGSLLVTLPAIAAIAASVAVIRSQKEGLWQHQKTVAAKAGLGILIAIPALLATWVILYMMTKLLL